MPAWFLPILEEVVPLLLKLLVGGFQNHPQANDPEIQAKLQNHIDALAALKK